LVGLKKLLQNPEKSYDGGQFLQREGARRAVCDESPESGSGL